VPPGLNLIASASRRVVAQLFVKRGALTAPRLLRTGYLPGGEPISVSSYRYSPGHVSIRLLDENGRTTAYFSHKRQSDPLSRVVEWPEQMREPTAEELVPGSEAQKSFLNDLETITSARNNFRLNPPPRAPEGEPFVNSSRLSIYAGRQSTEQADHIPEVGAQPPAGIEQIDLTSDVFDPQLLQTATRAEVARNSPFGLRPVDGQCGEHCTSSVARILGQSTRPNVPKLPTTADDSPESLGEHVKALLRAPSVSSAPADVDAVASPASAGDAELASLAADAAEAAGAAILL